MILSRASQTAVPVRRSGKDKDMKKNYHKKITLAAAGSLAALAILGCTAADDQQVQAAVQTTQVEQAAPAGTTADAEASGTEASSALIDSSELFSDRDLAQEADLTDAVYYEVEDSKDIQITEEGVYVLSGDAEDVTVYVDTADDAKVQLVLDSLSITNSDFPCIYVLSADKVFVTTTDSENSLTVTGAFTADGDTNTDAVIFAKDDLILNGTGSLTIDSTDNAVSAKDDLKITGGTYVITASSKGFEANDSIVIGDGTFTVTAGTDAFHAENEDDDTLGYMWIGGGEFSLEAGDDAIHANAFLQIDGGTFDITAAEGIESTSIRINDGEITIAASDDGINAAAKSSSYSIYIEINGGNISITMGQGDTDGIDSNGDITINGGTISIDGMSAFDCDGRASLNGGTLICNGQEVTSIPTQMMGGGMMNGGMGGQMPGMIQDGTMPGAPQDGMMNGAPQGGPGQSRNGNMRGMGGRPGGMNTQQGGFGGQMPGTMQDGTMSGVPQDGTMSGEAADDSNDQNVSDSDTDADAETP